MTYTYDLAAMDTFVTNLNQRVTELTNRRTEVEATVTKVLSQYEGPAADEFATTLAAWQKDMQTATERIEAMSKHVATCKANYEEAQKTIDQLLGGLPS